MKQVFSSASKLVFLMLSFTVCVGFMRGLLSSGDFMSLVGMAFVYYFTRAKKEKETGGPNVP